MEKQFVQLGTCFWKERENNEATILFQCGPSAAVSNRADNTPAPPAVQMFPTVSLIDLAKAVLECEHLSKISRNHVRNEIRLLIAPLTISTVPVLCNATDKLGSHHNKLNSIYTNFWHNFSMQKLTVWWHSWKCTRVPPSLYYGLTKLSIFDIIPKSQRLNIFEFLTSPQIVQICLTMLNYQSLCTSWHCRSIYTSK